jgi:hypothetical protein
VAGELDGGRSHVYWPSREEAAVVADRLRAALDGPGDRREVLHMFTDGLEPGDVDLLRALLSG